MSRYLRGNFQSSASGGLLKTALIFFITSFFCGLPLCEAYTLPECTRTASNQLEKLDRTGGEVVSTTAGKRLTFDFSGLPTGFTWNDGSGSTYRVSLSQDRITKTGSDGTSEVICQPIKMDETGGPADAANSKNCAVSTHIAAILGMAKNAAEGSHDKFVMDCATSMVSAMQKNENDKILSSPGARVPIMAAFKSVNRNLRKLLSPE